MLQVHSAIPCRSIENNDSDVQLDRHTNVELDPASEVEMRELVAQKNWRVVGWYHSHPTFLPNPSLIDLLNQKSYQAFFRASEDVEMENKVCLEPFVGAIVGTFYCFIKLQSVLKLFFLKKTIF